MDDKEIQSRIIAALNDAWNNRNSGRFYGILLTATRLAKQFQFGIMYRPSVGFEIEKES